MPELDFYYDIASPYSYLSAARINALAANAGVQVNWKPFLLGGVFKTVGNTMPASVPARAVYLHQDLQRWAERDGIEFRFSSTFPHNSLLAMRALTAAPADALVSLSLSLFRATWVDNQDLSDPMVVTAALGDHSALVEAASDPVIKKQLIDTTTQAIEAGAFGAPAFVTGGELFWGNDRLEMAIAAAVAQSSNDGS